MATAAKERRVLTSIMEVPLNTEMGEDGFPVRYELVNGEPTPFSLKPYPEEERPLYWNPVYPGQEMRLRSTLANEHGMRPVVQKEAWEFGKFRPRNPWEEHMTREWMKHNLPGCANPDLWRGVNHPKGPAYEWRCHCTWPCGNFDAFEQHQQYLRHFRGMTTEKTSPPDVRRTDWRAQFSEADS